YAPPAALFRLARAPPPDRHTSARLERRWGQHRWPASTGTARAACGCHNALADRVIPPGTWATPSVSRPLARILGNSRFGIGPTGEPAGGDRPHVGGHGLGFLPLRGCRGLRLRLDQLNRMPHHNAQCRLSDAPIAVFDLHRAAHTVAMPAPGRLVLRPPGFRHQQGQGGLRAPPGFECVPDSTRAWDKRAEIDLVLDTAPQGTATLGLPIGDDAPHPCEPQGQTLLKGYGGFPTSTAVRIAQANAQRYPPIPAHAETQPDLLEIVTTVFAMPIGRARRS